MALLAMAAQAHAGGFDLVKDTVGYTDLVTRYGGSLATGSGVRIWQTEFSGSPLAYVPAPASLATWGVTMDFGGVSATTSGHADAVGDFLYQGAAPGVTLAVGTDADAFVGAHGLRVGQGTLPPVFNGTGTYTGIKPLVLNASWIGTADLPFTDDMILRRADGLVAEQGITMVVGVNNGSSTPLAPALLGQAYNVIAVGRSDLQHANGVSTDDGLGRVVLDLVAPATVTSFATPIVASAATLLVDKAQSTAGLGNAIDPQVVRSLLMTGAEKLPGWNHSSTQPTDLIQGAGELRINHSYDLLLAGEVAPGILSGDSGWDLGSIGSGGKSRYTFFHDGGRFTATLNWNRTISSYNSDDTVTPDALINLDLRLFDSDSTGTIGLLLDSSVSPLDNVEHLFENSLPEGWYSLELSGPVNAPYGFSFQSIPEIRFPLVAGIVFLVWAWGRHRVKSN